MKNHLLLATVLMLVATSSFGQKFFTKSGKIDFDATSPASPEKIEGVNRTATCVVDTKTGAIQFAVLMKGFAFETVKGKLTIHGETKEVETPGKLTVQGGKINANASFSILLSDYKVSIPGLVADKVSKTAKLIISCSLEPLKS